MTKEEFIEQKKQAMSELSGEMNKLIAEAERCKNDPADLLRIGFDIVHVRNQMFLIQSQPFPADGLPMMVGESGGKEIIRIPGTMLFRSAPSESEEDYELRKLLAECFNKH